MRVKDIERIRKEGVKAGFDYDGKMPKCPYYDELSRAAWFSGVAIGLKGRANFLIFLVIMAIITTISLFVVVGELLVNG